MREFLGLPPDFSATGWQIDQLIIIVHWFMFALFAFWGAYFVYVLVRFRAGRQPKAIYEGAKAGWSKFVEVGVVLFEIVLLVGFAFPIWSQRVKEQPPEEGATRVRVVEVVETPEVRAPGGWSSPRR